MTPCPFCGERHDLEIVEVALNHNCEDWNFHIRCEYCGALGPTSGIEKLAREAWDDRPEKCRICGARTSEKCECEEDKP
jgi:hypothetical protein